MVIRVKLKIVQVWKLAAGNLEERSRTFLSSAERYENRNFRDLRDRAKHIARLSTDLTFCNRRDRGDDNSSHTDRY